MDIIKKYLSAIKSYFDVSYFVQAGGIIAWALFFYFIKYYNSSDASATEEPPMPLTYIDYFQVPAFASGFPVTVSSILSAGTIHAGRLTARYDRYSTGIRAWCANNNLTGEWIQLSSYDSTPLNWTLLSFGGRGDITNVVKLNVTVSVSNNSYEFTEIGSFQFSDIANRAKNVTLHSAVGRHLRVSPTSWAGNNPCLRLEAYFSAQVERNVTVL